MKTEKDGYIKQILAIYPDARVIWVINPSIIIINNGTSYTVYKSIAQHQGKFVICKGEDRSYFDEIEEIKTIIK